MDYNFIIINFMVNEILTKKKGIFSVGSACFQILKFSSKITNLAQHCINNKKDYSSRLSLIKLFGRRKRLLIFLKKFSKETYDYTMQKLAVKK